MKGWWYLLNFPGKLQSKYYILFYITCILIFLLRGSIYAEDNNAKNVLIINSYQKGLSWTDGETDGILSILKSSETKYNTIVEYMDWKNYPTQENFNYIYSLFKYKYSKKHMDLIVTTDDSALKFALQNRDQLFKDTPVVFCGVNNNGVSKITKGYSNVTGVTETIDAEGTIRAALQLIPNLKKVYVIFDNTESGVSTGSLTLLAAQRLAPYLEVIPLNEGSYKDILTKVGQAEDDSIVLLTTYYVDTAGTIVGLDDFSFMVSQNSRVPVFHLYDFGIGRGAVGGSMLSGRLQGEYAGKIAEMVLQGKDINQISINSDKTTQYIFDYLQLKRFNIDLDLLPKDSKLINKPFSFIETYKNLVISVVIIILLLVTFICILLYYLRRISKMKQELSKNNTSLVQLYEDLAASDKELKQQFDELSEMQKNLVTSEEQYSLLFEKMLNGFFVFKPVLDHENKLIDICFVTANPGFEAHTSKRIDNISGKTWAEVFKYPNRDLALFQKVLITGEAQHFETYYPDGNVHYLVNAFKVKGNEIGIVFDNITEYKQAIREVRKLNQELEQRVTERTNELQLVVKELEAFAYTVSHDLKSPLRAVDSYSKIFLEDYGKGLNKDATKMILHISNICNEMIEMINKLLEYSITARAILSTEEVNMEEVFLGIFSVLKSTYPKRSIELKIETGLPTISADRTLIKQAVYNILSNAIKFTKNREYANIIVGSTITESEYVFYIRDNGVGFDMNYASKLFGIFQRLHTSSEFEGSGIGLVTIKKIIEKHGGRIWIEGNVNIGSTVYFTLPLKW